MDEIRIAQSACPDPTQQTENRETRPCRYCQGPGTVVEDAQYDSISGELIQVVSTCPICHGAGEISVYRYPKARRS